MRACARGAIGMGMVALAVLLLASGDAAAFCRATSEPPTADYVPSAGACWTGGKPLYWKNECVGFSVQKDGTEQFTLAEASDVIATSFATWSAPTCATAGTPSLTVTASELVDCTLVEFSVTGPNHNVIVFRDKEWPHNDPNNTLALTTLTFEKTTGEIYDADMEVNTFGQKMTAKDPIPLNGYDFQSVITHEAGHFMGLAHSFEPNATMYARYIPGTKNLRNLTSDDVDGICAAYGPDGARATSAGKLAGTSCNKTPYGGFTKLCASETTPSDDEPGCAVASVGRTGSASKRASALSAFGIALSLAAVRTTRRRARRYFGGNTKP